VRAKKKEIIKETSFFFYKNCKKWLALFNVFVYFAIFIYKSTKMRKTTQKDSPKTLKIEKIDFQHGTPGSEKGQQIGDIRFESSNKKEFSHESTPSIKQIINYHQVNKQLYLRFYGYPLEGLPKEVCSLKHLQGLSILHCQLRRLPPHIADLHKLRHLFLINNRLESLPNELTTMKHLQYLDVSENQLTVLPTDFENLVKLTDFI
jgi:Leucine-rich repeat (LRR) protein